MHTGVASETRDSPGQSDTERRGDQETGGSGEESEAGVSTLDANAERSPAAPVEGGPNGSQSAPAPDNPPGPGGESAGGQNPAELGNKPARTTHPRITDLEFQIAAKNANGNVLLIAKAIGLSKGRVIDRINRTPQLFALYGLKSNRIDLGMIKPPADAETLIRNPGEIVAPTDGQLVNMVVETEKVIRDGLEKVGVSKTAIARLKSFDGLNIKAGQFLVQSLQDIKNLYYVNLIGLDEMAQGIKTRYLDVNATETTTPMERMFWQRAYNEIVDQLGKGFDRMLSGTQAMVAIQKAQSGDKGRGGGAKAKPGW